MTGKNIHFIGIGGIGMSGIARLFLRRGLKVSGSDLKTSKIISELRELGANIFIGHNPENIRGADSIVYSSAISDDNPELIAAKSEGLSLIKRAQALAELMKDKTSIAVTGSHGKTTVTSLIAHLLLKANLCPTVAVGGILKNIGTNACLGEGKFFVAEADESDGSFLYYRAKYSVLTNIDREHLDYYRDFKNEIEAFRKFVELTEPGGCVFGCGDDVNVRDILTARGNRYVLFGLDETSHIYPANIKIDGLSCEFDCYYKGGYIAVFKMSLGGTHNISNALAVIALGLELGIDIKIIGEALSSYSGAGRRIEVKFKDSDCVVIDDYAHHPTEIKATLAAVKNLKKQRVVAIFQPHRFSRTKLLLDDFAKSFDLADYVVITDIYAASELNREGIDAGCLYAKIKEYAPSKPVNFLPKEEITGHILKIRRPGDLIITLGAGDIVKVCDELVEKIKGQSQAQ